jgi:hypothetical protein
MLDAVDQIGDPHLHAQQARRADSPEIRLLAAILEDVRVCLAPGTLVDRATRRDAIAWVRGEVASVGPCSFHEICAILDLDEAATRARLLALASGETPERRRRLDSLLRRPSTADRVVDLPLRRPASGPTPAGHAVR